MQLARYDKVPEKIARGDNAAVRRRMKNLTAGDDMVGNRTPLFRR